MHRGLPLDHTLTTRNLGLAKHKKWNEWGATFVSTARGRTTFKKGPRAQRGRWLMRLGLLEVLSLTGAGVCWQMPWCCLTNPPW